MAMRERLGETSWGILDSFLKDLALEIHLDNRDKGFYDDVNPKDPRHIVSILALIQTEVSEAVEAVRRDPDAPCDKLGVELTGLEEEWADTVIRLFDFAAFMDFDPGRAIKLKHVYNQTRALRHGGKRC